MRRTDASGFSLIEVVIALGMLDAVLLSIGGLFVIGSRTVRSGRASSESMAMAKKISEDMGGWGFTQLWGNFGLSGSGQTTYTIDCRTNTANGFCPGWQTTIQGELGTTAYSTITLTSVTDAAGNTPVFVDAATGATKARNVRVLITVFWTEITGRTRNIQLDTTRN